MILGCTVLINMRCNSFFKKILIFLLLCIVPFFNELYIEEKYFIYAQSKMADIPKILYAIFVIIIGYKSKLKLSSIAILIFFTFLSNFTSVLLFVWILIGGFV